MELKNASICGDTLVVKPYGGGVRYYCPSCDVRRAWGIATVSWTNGSPGPNRVCNNSEKSATKRGN